MVYEIHIKVTVGEIARGIYCYFAFKNPLVNDYSSMTVFKGGTESNMKFVKRIKEYIKSNEFLYNIKKTIIKDADEYNKKQKISMDYEELKKELDGMEFSVKVDID